MDSLGVGTGHRPARATPAVTRRQRRAFLDQVRRGQLGIEAVLERADTDLLVAKTDVRQLVEAFLWHAGTAETVAVLTRAGITGGRRVGALAGWQRAVLISALG